VKSKRNQQAYFEKFQEQREQELLCSENFRIEGGCVPKIIRSKETQMDLVKKISDQKGDKAKDSLFCGV